MNYKVSFCIPSYENKNAVMRMIMDLLSCKQKEIQIVVCDDASTDGTYEELRDIKDKRLKVIHNEKNIGAKLNWNKTLEAGDGDYLYLVMGRDFLAVSKMDKLINMLYIFDDKDISIAMDRKYKGGIQTLKKAEALGFMIGAHHPTGLILKRRAYTEIINRESYFKLNTTYPENYIKKELIMNYTVGIGYSGLFTDKTIIDLGKLRSRVEVSKNLEDAYFFPMQRIKEGINMLKMFKKSDVDLKEDEYKFFYQSMLRQFSDWILIWKEHCESIDWMRHYGFRERLVSKSELLKYLEAFENELVKLEPEMKEENNNFHYLTLKMIEYRFSEGYWYRASLKMQLTQKLIGTCMESSINKYFYDNHIFSVAIYGFGEIGSILFELLQKSNVNVKYAIDRDYLYRYSSLDIFSPEDELPNADALIISLVNKMEKIKNRFLYQYNKIISVEELVYEL